jgi:hypothetical protein
MPLLKTIFIFILVAFCTENDFQYQVSSGGKLIEHVTGLIRTGAGAVSLCLGICMASTGLAKPTSEAVADRVMKALRAANTARSDNAREDTTWRTEAERLRVVEATVRQQIADLKRRSDAHQDATKLTKKQLANLTPDQEKKAAHEALALTQAERIHEGLDRLASEVPPGVIPARPKRSTAPLTDALRRMESARKTARRIAVELTSGKLDGEDRAVELLRAGGAVAWWRALDGKQAGTATVENGQLILVAVTDSAVTEAIIKGVDIAKGRKAPALVELPVHHARRMESNP